METHSFAHGACPTNDPQDTLRETFEKLRGEEDELSEFARALVIPEGALCVAVALEQVREKISLAETLCLRLRVFP